MTIRASYADGSSTSHVGRPDTGASNNDLVRIKIYIHAHRKNMEKRWLKPKNLLGESWKSTRQPLLRLKIMDFMMHFHYGSGF